MDALRAHRAIAAIFFLNGMSFGTFASRIPAIRDHAGVGDGALGLALACVAGGAVLAMPLAGALSARRGSAGVVRFAVLVFGVGVGLIAFSPSLTVLCLTGLLLGFGNGFLDVSMNAHGLAIEKERATQLLGGLHAAFSAGGLTGALAGGALAAARVDPRVQLPATAVVVLAVGLLAAARLLPAHVDASGEAEALFVRPPRRLWLLGAVIFACFQIEGAASDWSAVYLRDELGTTDGLAALGFAGFSVAMTTGRLFGDRIVRAVGARRVVTTGGLVAAAGFGAALLVAAPAAGLAGCVCLGAGMAGVAAIVFRAAGATPGLPAGVALAAVSTTGYFGFLSGPPVIGGLAELVTLPVALAWLVVLALAVAAGGRRV